MVSNPSVSTKKATAYVAGTSILWASIVELGIAEIMRAFAFGVANVMLSLSGIQADLLVGLGEFLASYVVLWSEGPTAAIQAAWDGPAFEMFGILAPAVVMVEILVITYVALWAVRRL